MKVTSVNKRVQYIIEQKQLTSSKFADEIGVIRSSISHIISGRNKPGLELLQKILNRYNEINSEWLILGKGEVFRNRVPKEESRPADLLVKSKQLSLLDYSEEQERYTGALKAKQQQIDEESKALPYKDIKSGEEQSRAGEIRLPKENKDIERITIYFSDNSYKDFFPK